MRKVISYLLVLLITTSMGCLNLQKKPDKIDNRDSYRTTKDALEKKISLINRIIEEKNLTERDKVIALTILDYYNLFHNKLEILSECPAGQELMSDLYFSLSSADEQFFSSTQNASNDYPEVIRLFAKAKEDILNAYLTGDFTGVITKCIDLKSNFGPESLTSDIGLIFALSLAKKGMLNDAVIIGEKIAGKLESNPDIVQLQTKIAQWHLQQGQLEKAIATHEKLLDTQDERDMLIKSLHKKISAAKKAGPDTDTHLPGRIQLQHLEVGIDHLLEEVEKLLEENRFNEARELLIPVMGESHPATDKEKINQALKKLELAEEYYLEQKISMISMKRDMEQAQKLLEEERFEEVISKLEAIETEQGDTREITELKRFAIEKLINRERNKAASIYLTAKQTPDPGKKAANLRKALEILNRLIEEYPLSNLNVKLLSNIRTVEEELDKLQIDTE